MEKIKLNPTSHSNTKNQYQDTDLNVYTKTIKLIEKKMWNIFLPLGQVNVSYTRGGCP